MLFDWRVWSEGCNFDRQSSRGRAELNPVYFTLISSLSLSLTHVHDARRECEKFNLINSRVSASSWLSVCRNINFDPFHVLCSGGLVLLKNYRRHRFARYFLLSSALQQQFFGRSITSHFSWIWCVALKSLEQNGNKSSLSPYSRREQS